MFRVGQKVVCVDASNYSTGIWFKRRLVKGRVYTVVKVGSCAQADAGQGILLAEIEQASGRMWRATRFRPIVERSTDISVFTEILRRETLPSTPSPLPLVEVDR